MVKFEINFSKKIAFLNLFALQNAEKTKDTLPLFTSIWRFLYNILKAVVQKDQLYLLIVYTVSYFGKNL